MALIKCPECGREVPEKAPACIFCGYPLQTEKDNQGFNPEELLLNKEESASQRARKAQKRKVIGITAAVVVALLLVVAFFLFNPPSLAPEDLEGIGAAMKQDIDNNFGTAISLETTYFVNQNTLQVTTILTDWDKPTLALMLVLNEITSMDEFRDKLLSYQTQACDAIGNRYLRSTSIEWIILSSDQAKIYSFLNNALTYDYYAESLASFDSAAEAIGTAISEVFKENNPHYVISDNHLNISIAMEYSNDSTSKENLTLAIEELQNIAEKSWSVLNSQGYGEIEFVFTLTNTEGIVLAEFSQGELTKDIRNGDTSEAEEDRELTDREKIEILKYLHSLEDEIYARESEYSDSVLNFMLDTAWDKTCKKFGVTEDDILKIMSDTDLVRRSYQ